MTTLGIITKELEEVKLKLKVAKACETIVNAFLNKDKFIYQNPLKQDEQISLFSDNLFRCGRLDFKLQNVKHYEDIHKIIFYKSSGKTKELALSLIHI